MAAAVCCEDFVSASQCVQAAEASSPGAQIGKSLPFFVACSDFPRVGLSSSRASDWLQQFGPGLEEQLLQRHSQTYLHIIMYSLEQQETRSKKLNIYE